LVIISQEKRSPRSFAMQCVKQKKQRDPTNHQTLEGFPIHPILIYHIQVTEPRQCFGKALLLGWTPYRLEEEVHPYLEWFQEVAPLATHLDLFICLTAGRTLIANKVRCPIHLSHPASNPTTQDTSCHQEWQHTGPTCIRRGHLVLRAMPRLLPKTRLRLEVKDEDEVTAQLILFRFQWRQGQCLHPIEQGQQL